MSSRSKAAGLEVEDLCFAPPGSDARWGPVSFGVGPGETVGLCGASGSGKSLLLRALADLDEHSGRVCLGGTGQTEVAAPAWRRRVGVLPADTAWWFDSVGEHFDGAVADAMLGMLGFEPGAMDWPVARLSAGEKQRLALARMLSRGPEALLLDEPTANLDVESVSKVEQVIVRYQSRHRCPVVWVGHSRDQLRRLAGVVFEMRERGLHLLES